MKANNSFDLVLSLRQLSNKVRVTFSPDDAGTIMLAAATIETHRQCVDSMNHQAQEVRSTTEETPAKSADISEAWVSDVIAMLHAVAGDLSEDNRIMALAAQSLILTAPRLTYVPDGVYHDWLGGECPVGANDIVDVQFRSGQNSGNTNAGALIWHHDGGGYDIVSWVLVERNHDTKK